MMRFSSASASKAIATKNQLNAGASSKDAITIEQILEEKEIFDVSRAFEKIGLQEGEIGWTSPAPSIPETIDSPASSSNLLHASVETLGRGSEAKGILLVTGADRSLRILNPLSPYHDLPINLELSDAPILSCSVLSRRYLIATSMSGKIILHDLQTGNRLDERRDHQKYVVKVVTCEDETGAWIATAAWDAKICVYHLGDSSSAQYRLGEPVAQLKLRSNPESILFIRHPEISSPVLLVGRRDSTSLEYYALPENTPMTDERPASLIYLGKQNLAPNANAWVTFSPSAFSISPRDSSILAVATSAVPHMKLIIVRLLLPRPPRADGTIAEHVELTQVSQGRASLALQDREAAAILIHVTTFAPQTEYSTPALAWRPDASGIFVNGDDGLVRGLEATTGKIVSTLKGGHELGSKVRCLWAGWADQEKKEEVVISGGFDKRLIVWKIEAVKAND